MKPSIGRMVHYVSSGTPGGEYASECRAAVITGVQDDPQASASLCVLNPAGIFFDQAVPCDEGPDEGTGTSLCGGKLFRGGSWHWPERVPPEAGVPAGLDPGPLNLAPGQVRSVVEQVQAKLLQVTVRNRRTGIEMPGETA
jgi:hypothetical protein